MRVVLKKDVKGIGRAGQIVDVADGYGRNFLLLRGLALLADAVVMARLTRERAQAEKAAARDAATAEKLAWRLKGKTFVFNLPSGDKGQLFAGLKEKEILLKIRQSEGALPEGAKLVGFQPLRTTGTHEARLRLPNDTDISFQITIHGK